MVEALLYHPVALAELEVTVTNSRPPDVTYNIFREWLKMSPMEQHVALVQANDVAGVIYWDDDGNLNTVSIITTPTVYKDWKEWVISQQGNRLTNGPDALELCGLVLVPMWEALADALGLKWDPTLILATENCPLWTGGAIDTNFPGTGDLCMVDFPCDFPFGYGNIFQRILWIIFWQPLFQQQQ